MSPATEEMASRRKEGSEAVEEDDELGFRAERMIWLNNVEDVPIRKPELSKPRTQAEEEATLPEVKLVPRY